MSKSSNKRTSHIVRKKKRDREEDDHSVAPNTSPHIPEKIDILQLIISELGIRVQKPGVKLQIQHPITEEQPIEYPKNIQIDFPNGFIDKFIDSKRIESECVFGRYDSDNFIPGLLDIDGFNRVKSFLDDMYSNDTDLTNTKKYLNEIIASERRITDGSRVTYELKTLYKNQDVKDWGIRISMKKEDKLSDPSNFDRKWANRFSIKNDDIKKYRTREITRYTYTTSDDNNEYHGFRVDLSIVTETMLQRPPSLKYELEVECIKNLLDGRSTDDVFKSLVKLLEMLYNTANTKYPDEIPLSFAEKYHVQSVIKNSIGLYENRPVSLKTFSLLKMHHAVSTKINGTRCYVAVLNNKVYYSTNFTNPLGVHIISTSQKLSKYNMTVLDCEFVDFSKISRKQNTLDITKFYILDVIQFKNANVGLKNFNDRFGLLFDEEKLSKYQDLIESPSTSFEKYREIIQLIDAIQTRIENNRFLSEFLDENVGASVVKRINAVFNEDLLKNFEVHLKQFKNTPNQTAIEQYDSFTKEYNEIGEYKSRIRRNLATNTHLTTFIDNLIVKKGGVDASKVHTKRYGVLISERVMGRYQQTLETPPSTFDKFVEIYNTREYLSSKYSDNVKLSKFIQTIFDDDDIRNIQSEYNELSLGGSSLKKVTARLEKSLEIKYKSLKKDNPKFKSSLETFWSIVHRSKSSEFINTLSSSSTFFKFEEQTYLNTHGTIDGMYSAVNELLNKTKINSLYTKYDFTDGLIFQPLSEVYVNISTFKWKPNPTIDFIVIDGKLYSWDKALRKNVPFVGNYVQKYSPSETYENLSNNQVYEFEWDPSNETFKMLRNRADKLYPNEINVAKDVWNDIHIPITEKTIRGNTITLMKKFHNDKKRMLLDEIPNNSKIIDIGSGQGGDIQKWNDKKLQVIAVEPDAEKIKAFKSRLENIPDSYVRYIFYNDRIYTDPFKKGNGYIIDGRFVKGNVAIPANKFLVTGGVLKGGIGYKLVGSSTNQVFITEFPKIRPESVQIRDVATSSSDKFPRIEIDISGKMYPASIDKNIVRFAPQFITILPSQLKSVKERVIVPDNNIIIIPTGAENHTEIAKYSSNLNAIVSFFSLTFFPKSEEMYKSLLKTVNLLPEGGMFIFAVMDGARVLEKMDKSTFSFVTKSFSIKKVTSTHPEDVNFAKNNSDNKIISNFSESRIKNVEEYLFYTDAFKADLEKTFSCKSVGTFSNHNLPKDSRELSECYKYYTFVKKPVKAGNTTQRILKPKTGLSARDLQCQFENLHYFYALIDPGKKGQLDDCILTAINEKHYSNAKNKASFVEKFHDKYPNLEKINEKLSINVFILEYTGTKKLSLSRESIDAYDRNIEKYVLILKYTHAKDTYPTYYIISTGLNTTIFRYNDSLISSILSSTRMPDENRHLPDDEILSFEDLSDDDEGSSVEASDDE